MTASISENPEGYEARLDVELGYGLASVRSVFHWFGFSSTSRLLNLRTSSGSEESGTGSVRNRRDRKELPMGAYVVN
jgi:hypothetical protein